MDLQTKKEFDALKMEDLTAGELAARMAEKGYWDAAECYLLCEMADMTREYEASEPEEAEAVVEKAAEKLGVEI